MTKEIIISFLTRVTSLYQSNIYDENDDKDSKKAILCIPFLFDFSLLTGKPQVESVYRMYVCVKQGKNRIGCLG